MKHSMLSDDRRRLDYVIEFDQIYFQDVRFIAEYMVKSHRNICNEIYQEFWAIGRSQGNAPVRWPIE